MKNFMIFLGLVLLLTGAAYAADRYSAAISVDVSANTAVLDSATDAVFVGTAGNLVVKMDAGPIVTYNTAAGTLLPIAVQTIYNTSTAGDIVGLKY